jgi:hypothetical protein
LPAPDVAAQGGWKNISVVQEVYMQADSATLLRVLTEPMELRELPVRGFPEGAEPREVG